MRPVVNGLYRLGTEAEQLRLYERFEDAMALRHPVRLTYFRQKSQRDPATGKPQYVRTTRTVEPYELDMTLDGAMIVRVIDRTPRHDKRPAYRTIRLDRIAFSRTTGHALMNMRTRDRYLLPSPLDGAELHPTKGELTGVAP